jgi:hypothetical protein
VIRLNSFRKLSGLARPDHVLTVYYRTIFGFPFATHAPAVWNRSVDIGTVPPQFQARLASLDRGPEFQQAIMADYRNAWPRNQPIFESLAADADTGVAQFLAPASQIESDWPTAAASWKTGVEFACPSSPAGLDVSACAASRVAKAAPTHKDQRIPSRQFRNCQGQQR